jgi:hypothetical protein
MQIDGGPDVPLEVSSGCNCKLMNNAALASLAPVLYRHAISSVPVEHPDPDLQALIHPKLLGIDSRISKARGAPAVRSNSPKLSDERSII